jgi:tetratricopeptide (TPR) repeat protein
LPESRERTRQELDFQITLGHTLAVVQSPAAPAVVQAHRRAEALCQQVGEMRQRVAVLRGLRRAYQGQGAYSAAQTTAEQFLDLARQAEDAGLLTEAYVVLGVCAMYGGKVMAAHPHFAEGLALYEANRHPLHASQFGQDIGVVGLTHDALALWLLGYPDQALARADRALALAQELSQPLSLATAMSYAVVLHVMRRDPQAVLVQAEATIQLATDRGFSLGSIR